MTPLDYAACRSFPSAAVSIAMASQNTKLDSLQPFAAP